MLRVPQLLLEHTLAHLHRLAPCEGVGLWAGTKGRVSEVIELPNIHAKPQVAYEAEPLALVRAIGDIEERGLELLAIYHSHPTGPAWPSQSDKTQAFWRVPYVIVALQSGDIKAYRLPEETEVMIQIETQTIVTRGQHVV
jgi:proteasome lid subunit RPN8/RPN11